jgi:FKBP-type peptidyl-prolyl cis-trans isomerase 2
MFILYQKINKKSKGNYLKLPHCACIKGKIIPGFEQAIVGMNQGDSKTTIVAADVAYGPHHEEVVVVVDRN